MEVGTGMATSYAGIMFHMEPWILALILKPIALLFLFGFICLPGRLFVQRFMRDGRLKRLLLKRIS